MINYYNIQERFFLICRCICISGNCQAAVNDIYVLGHFTKLSLQGVSVER